MTPAQFRARAREYAAEALKLICRIMRNEAAPDTARLHAVRLLLDYAFGPPTTMQEAASVKQTVEDIAELPREERIELLENALELERRGDFDPRTLFE